MKYQKILATTDFSEQGDLALRRAAELALESGACLIAMHVLPEPESPSPLIAHYGGEWSADKVAQVRADALAVLRERIPAELRDSMKVEYAIEIGDPANEILEMDRERQPDLIVLATHGRRGWQRWIMGSVAERVVQMARADVLAVRDRPELDQD